MCIRDSNSWNHGVEGPTSNLSIKELRKRQQKNFLFSLFISKGVPMLLMGDEIGRSQGGNNNSWCQNNTLGWMNWDENQQDLELLNYLKYLIKIRKKFINFLNPISLLNNKDINNQVNYYWHGAKLERPDWSSWSHTIAFSINKGKNNPLIWAGLNAYSKSIDFHLPKSKSKWLKVIDTKESLTSVPIPIKDTFIKVDNRSSVLIISEEMFGTKSKIF